MNFLDLFAGIGGFRLGMERAGHKCIGYVEFDKFARKSYKAMHDTEGEWTAHDITRVTDDDIRQLRDRGRIDIICGGFPCQAFSIAGQRKGFDDTRGTLFFDIARFASIIRPRYLFLENVRGLLNHDNGNTFETILRTFDELGYDVEWDLLNSKDFGVPQNRERVFIIGHLRGASTRKIFPITRENGTINKNDIKQIGNIDQHKRKRENPNTGRDYDINGISPTLSTMQGGGLEPKIKVIGNTSKTNHRSHDVHDVSGISPTIAARDYKGPKQIALRENTKKGYVEATVGDGVRLDHPNGTTGRGRVQVQSSSTITTSGNVGTITNDLRIRKLTPKECFRLQGFPDELFNKAQKVNSDSQLYKQAGNSVTVNVIHAIAKKF